VTDYDTTDIPAGYDCARDHGPENLNLWMRAITAHLSVPKLGRILDLGCGTGRFSEALAAHFGAEVIGLDPSAKMLDRARQKLHDDRVRYCRGRAEAIPVSAGSVDLVFMSMSFHHFTEPIVATGECRRVLRNDGSVMLRTGTREKIAVYPYTPFFPSIPAILEDMLPDHRELCEIFRSARLELATNDTIAQTIAPNWMAYAEKLAAGGDSALARLSRRDFETGLDAVRRYGVASDGGPVIEPIDLFVFRAA
jgi:ubiquinone/menaquinone biosynthesis C-methylase UbiE